MDYEINCYGKFSWGYVYTFNCIRGEIWADNVDDLKRKVLAKSLSGNYVKVLKAKEVKITGGMWKLRKVQHHLDFPDARVTIKDNNLYIFNNNILP